MSDETKSTEHLMDEIDTIMDGQTVQTAANIFLYQTSRVFYYLMRDNNFTREDMFEKINQGVTTYFDAFDKHIGEELDKLSSTVQ